MSFSIPLIKEKILSEIDFSQLIPKTNTKPVLISEHGFCVLSMFFCGNKAPFVIVIFGVICYYIYALTNYSTKEKRICYAD